MRCFTLAALVLGLIGAAFTSPIDAAANTDIATVPFTNQTVTALEPRGDDPELPEPTCETHYKLFRTSAVVKIPKLPDSVEVDDICNKLWQGLKSRWNCGVTSPHGCGPSRTPGEAMLEWHFHVPIICTKNSLEETFKEATNDGEWGEIVCRVV